MKSMLERVCGMTCHDWFTLSYPPVRRQKCTKCGLITEDAYTDTIKKN